MNAICHAVTQAKDSFPEAKLIVPPTHGHSTSETNTILPCQDQYFTGDQSYNCPYSTTPSETSVDVSTETWVSFWAAGLLDNSEPQQAPQAQDSSSNLNFPILDSCSWEEAQLSSQLYRNKQLQETLVQKEEELARLHEENNHLRQYLNSTSVKCFEEKAKAYTDAEAQYAMQGNKDEAAE
ncbi:geminin coiled-coil domain-containing protein 1-like [Callospermophilus lateralis]|uniref:geminin coiled-coil domain-containing protein 1-like n=1 Tax=Callospermophilus lateralis TaxID=76772 RepID=UPI004038C2CB